MNILAHLYLSKGINEVMIGNFIGDFVKGKQYTQYETKVQNGILLHREIDTFTDKHNAHKLTRDRFREGYGLHSGIVVDIIYDHFLAKNWNKYSDISLEQFAEQAYAHINKNLHTMPVRMQHIAPFIIENNWLVMYRSISGIERVLNGMSKRTSLPSKASYAMQILQTNYKEIDSEFTLIFTDLREMVENSLYLTKFATK